MKTNLLSSLKMGLILLTSALGAQVASAATFTAVASGNWSSAATWGGTAPSFNLGLGDQITIGAGITVTMDSTVTINGLLSQLSVNGQLSSATNALIVTSGTLTGTGTLAVNSIVLNSGGTFSFSGTAVANSFTNSIASLSSSAAITVKKTLTLTGVIDVIASGSIKMDSNSVVIVSGGAITLNGGVLTLSNPYSVNYITTSTSAGMELSGSGLGKVTINVPSSSAVTLTSNVKLNDSLKMTSGTLVIGADSLVINGQVSGTGKFSGSSSSMLAITTSGGITTPFTFATGAQTLKSLTVNIGSGKSVAIASSLIVDNTLSLLGGSNLNITNTNFTLSGNYTGNGTLVVNGGTSLTLNGSASLSGDISLSGDLGSFNLGIGSGNTVTMGTDLDADTLNLTSGTVVLNSHNLTINGTILGGGTGLIFSAAPSNVSVTATASPAGSLTFSYPGNTVNNLTVNIGAAGSLNLNSDLVFNGTLAFTSGYLNIGSHNLQMSSTGSITGANANSYVITGTGGYLSIDASAAITATFPIGTSSYYAPAQITLNTGTSSGMVGVNVTPGVYAQGTSGTLLSTTQPMVDATWQVQTAISNYNANMVLIWSPAMEVNGFVHTGDYISANNGSTWDNVGDSMNASTYAGGMFSVKRDTTKKGGPYAVFDKSSVTGISQVVASNVFTVYPNPATDNLYIKNSEATNDLLNITIYDITGRAVSTYTTTNTETNISVSDLAPGQYFLKLYNTKSATVEKFIKL